MAALLVAGVGVWLASGLVQDDAPETPEADTEALAPLVQVARSEPRRVRRNIVVQGDVRPFRTATARAETAGQVAEILVNFGERVQSGQPIARLTLEGRGSRLREAQAVLDQREADYESAATLLERGFTTEAEVRALRTQLQSAREAVRQLQEELENTTVAAPFAGIVDTIDVEEGEFVSVNTPIATLVDNSPLRVIARVNQQDIARVPSGGPARVDFATGGTETGRICFVSASADPQTRTFRVEVRTPNPDDALPSGISAEVSVPTGTVPAHYISPAVLSLGTDGTLGVKTVTAEGVVEFQSVEVVQAETGGVWVSGLAGSPRIITIGQGFVQQGDRVRIAEATPAPEAVGGVPDGPAEAGEPPAPTICERRPTLVATDPASVAPASQPPAGETEAGSR